MPEFEPTLRPYSPVDTGAPAPLFQYAPTTRREMPDAPSAADIYASVLASRWDDDEAVAIKRAAISKYTPEQLASIVRDAQYTDFDDALRATRNFDVAYAAVTGQKADKETKIRLYSQRTGMDEQFIRDNYDTVDQKLIFIDKKRYIENKRNLSAWIADPRNLSVAQDSLESLSRLEGALVSRYGSFAERLLDTASNLRKTTRSGLAGAGRMSLDVLGEVAGAPLRVAAWAYNRNPEEAVSQDSVLGALQLSANYLGDVSRRESGMYVPFTKDVNPVESLAHDVTSGLLQMGGSLALGVIDPAIPIAMIGGMAGGQTYNDLRDEGVGVGRAVMAAAPSAVIQGALEGMQISRLGRLTGLKSFGSATFRTLARDWLENIAQETTQGVVGDMAKAFGESELMDVNFGQRFSESLRSGLHDGIVAAIASSLLSAPHLLRTYGSYRDSMKNAKAIMDSMGLVDAMPLEKRSPDVAAEAIHAVSGGQMASFDPEIIEAYAQQRYGADAGKFLQTFAQKLHIRPEQLAEAKTLGIPVEFRKADWLAHLNNTEDATALFPHIRWGDMSMEEAKAAKEELLNGLQAEHDMATSLSSGEDITPDQWKAFRKTLMDHGNSAHVADTMLATLYAFGRYAKREAGEIPLRYQNLELRYADNANEFMAMPAGVKFTAPKVEAKRTVDNVTDLTKIKDQPWYGQQVARTIEGADHSVKAGEYVEAQIRRRNNLEALLKCLGE